MDTETIKKLETLRNEAGDRRRMLLKLSAERTKLDVEQHDIELEIKRIEKEAAIEIVANLVEEYPESMLYFICDELREQLGN